MITCIFLLCLCVLWLLVLGGLCWTLQGGRDTTDDQQPDAKAKP